MRALLPRDRYEALSHSRYLNQASLGLIPRDSVEAMTAFLNDVAQHGNVRMSDAAEARVLDDLRAAAGTLLDAPERSIAASCDPKRRASWRCCGRARRGRDPRAIRRVRSSSDGMYV